MKQNDLKKSLGLVLFLLIFGGASWFVCYKVSLVRIAEAMESFGGFGFYFGLVIAVLTAVFMLFRRFWSASTSR